MAGLGFGPSDFALFEIEDPDERAAALDATLLPKLLQLGDGCTSGLGRVAGTELFLHAARPPRRRGAAPEEVLVAFSQSAKGYRGLPFLGVAVTRCHLHARVGVRGESPRRAAMQRALVREARPCSWVRCGRCSRVDCCIRLCWLPPWRVARWTAPGSWHCSHSAPASP